MANRIIGEDWIKNAILLNEVMLNANTNNSERNTFEFIVDKVNVPVSIIYSLGPNRLRIFRGYGEEVAKQRPQNLKSIFDAYEGEKTIGIIIHDEDENIADILEFKAKARRGLDAEMYGRLHETLILETINLI